MTMLGYVRGGADRQRRPESNVAPPPTKLSAPISSSHASRSTAHLTTIQVSGRNGHLATASASASLSSSSKNTASAAFDHAPYSSKKYNGTGYQSTDSASDRRKDAAIQQDQQLLLQHQQQQLRPHQEEARHPRRHSNSNGRPENSSSSGSSSIVSGADANVSHRDVHHSYCARMGGTFAKFSFYRQFFSRFHSSTISPSFPTPPSSYINCHPPIPFFFSIMSQRRRLLLFTDGSSRIEGSAVVLLLFTFLCCIVRSAFIVVFVVVVATLVVCVML